MRKEMKVMYTAPVVKVIDLETEESILALSNEGTGENTDKVPTPNSTSKRSIWEGEGIWK